MNYFNFYCSFLHMISQLQWQRCRYAETYSFGGPWVRIQARTENMSVIFFCADFSTFSYLKLASDTFGGIHKQYGLKRGRGRFFYLIYVITWFIVQYIHITAIKQDIWQLKIRNLSISKSIDVTAIHKHVKERLVL